ncbi:hypothetical protein EVAR_37627_1 [Eumeta japonica]|uniref:Uncharacterized protein n=1 Tax=Eumeta variegata TaxID=151549 RepID=A0A4C1VMB1_EUMVA|nr:hypothetical protein EVAR_37627_1 [Eumeta japonica]
MAKGRPARLLIRATHRQDENDDAATRPPTGRGSRQSTRQTSRYATIEPDALHARPVAVVVGWSGATISERPQMPKRRCTARTLTSSSVGRRRVRRQVAGSLCEQGQSVRGTRVKGPTLTRFCTMKALRF